MSNTKQEARVKRTEGERIVHKTWVGMKQRCYNENNPAYGNYGGRGIKICDEWKNDFWAFYDYIGDKPKPHKSYSIDRIDNDGNYEPGNVRWATRDEQSVNRRLYKTSKHGIAGIMWDEKNGGWAVQISVDGKNKHLGFFWTFEECVNALIDFRVRRSLNYEVTSVLEELEKKRLDFGGDPGFVDILESAIKSIKERYAS